MLEHRTLEFRKLEHRALRTGSTAVGQEHRILAHRIIEL